MEFALIAVPLLAAALAALAPSNRMRPWLLPAAAIAHLTLTAVFLARPELTAGSPWGASSCPWSARCS